MKADVWRNVNAIKIAENALSIFSCSTLVENEEEEEKRKKKHDRGEKSEECRCC